ncbi:hypothetical protein GOBAR_DD01799 [Gossypium barbadense]|nr:hypothetical protein GOBAR_DD01799 [Gossypium barbadense]
MVAMGCDKLQQFWGSGLVRGKRGLAVAVEDDQGVWLLLLAAKDVQCKVGEDARCCSMVVEKKSEWVRPVIVGVLWVRSRR